MNTQLSYRITAAIFIVMLLAFFAASCAPVPVTKAANPQPTQPAASQLSNEKAAAVAPAGNQLDPALAPADAVVIQSLTAQSAARIFTVAKIYQHPDASSEVVSQIMPGNSVTVLGLNGDGTFFAVNTGGEEGQVTGWIAASDLSYQKISTEAKSLTMIYAKPDSGSSSGILVPNQAISLIGTSPDGAWSAIATNRYDPKLTGWVRTSELSLTRPSGEMLYLTKTRLTADESSQVYDILTPTQKVALLGRTQDGSWIAVANPDGITFRGWVKTSEVKVIPGELALAVLPTH